MAKQKIIICDICGQQFSPDLINRAKLKVRKCEVDGRDVYFEFQLWEKYDLCPACVKHLISEVRKMRSDTDG